MSSLSRRACFKCGNVGHYAGMLFLLSHIGCWAAVGPVWEALFKDSPSHIALSVLPGRCHCPTVSDLHATNLSLCRGLLVFRKTLLQL